MKTPPNPSPKKQIPSSKCKNLQYGLVLTLIFILTGFGVVSFFSKEVEIETIGISSDGQTLAVSLMSFENEMSPIPEISNVRDWVRIYDINNWSYHDIDGDSTVDSIAFSPDGKYMARGYEGGGYSITGFRGSP